MPNILSAIPNHHPRLAHTPIQRSRRIHLALLSTILIPTLFGCHRPTPPEGITTATIDGTSTDLDALWDATLSVLQKFDFQPDRQDRAMGVITTVPTTSQQWHEPWRQDVADAYSLAESSLHTIQRKVTVRFVQGDPWSLEVQVDVYRLSRPQTQITSASSVLHGFTGALPTTEGRKLTPGQSTDRWVHLRRDGLLETHLLQRILNAAGVPEDDPA